MADGNEKIYVGSGKEHKFQDGGSVINLTLCLDGIGEYFQKYGFTSKGNKKYLKLIVSSRREKGEHGETHSLCIDTWKPDQQPEG